MSEITQTAIFHFLKDAPLSHVRRVKQIASGLESSTHLVATFANTYILTILRHPTDLELVRLSSQFFIEAGLPIPRILHQGTIQNHPAFLTSLLPGKVKPTWEEEPYEKVGFLLGAMHKIAESFPTQTKQPPLILSLLSDFYAIADSIPEEFYPLEEQLLLLEQYWPLHLPKGLIHGDLWYKNILFEHDEVSAILNFFKPTTDLFILDLASLAKGAIFAPMEENFSALLSAYQTVRPLSHQEWEALPAMILSKLIGTILHLLKRSIEEPSMKEELQTSALLNFFKAQSSFLGSSSDALGEILGRG